MQSKRLSLIEVLANIGTGFIISALLQQFVIGPIYNLPTSVSQNLEITIIFTVISVVRSYAFRRLFNRYVVRNLYAK
jgi:hypothetical protein